MIIWLSILNSIALAVLTKKDKQEKGIIALTILQVVLIGIYLVNYYFGQYSVWINDPFPWL